jgi:hypothetical protein
VTVASLYSLPLIVLKSSAKVADAKDKSKIVKSFICTCRLESSADLFSNISIPVKANCWAAEH